MVVVGMVAVKVAGQGMVVVGMVVVLHHVPT